MNAWKTILLWSDTHVPYHHEVAVANLTNFIGAIEPSEVIILGDFVDVKAPARWSRDLPDEIESNLQDEFDQADAVLAELDRVYDGPKKFMKGNHEVRMDSYLKVKAKAFRSLRDITIAKQLRFKEHGIVELQEGVPYMAAPGWAVIHGTKIRKHAGMSALAMVDDFGTSVAQGHSHRAGLLPQTKEKTRYAMECGHLSNVFKAEYLEYVGVANWQMAFGLLYVKGELVVPDLVFVNDDGSFHYNGVDVTPDNLTRRE